MRKGYFEAEGLDVKFQIVEGSGQTLQALASGQGQIGSPGTAPSLMARTRGVDVVSFYNYFPKNLFGLMVREESPYRTPADLKNKVIGVGTADGAEVGFTRQMLSDAGLVENTDYTFITVGDGGYAVAGFSRNDIDAYASAVTDSAILRQKGISLRDIAPEKFVAYLTGSFSAMGDFVEANPETIASFGRALARGSGFVVNPENKQAVLDHAKYANPQEGEDPEFAAALLDVVVDLISPMVADTDKGWGYTPPAGWKIWEESLVTTGDLKAPMDDLDAAYTNKFVGAFNER